MIPVSSVWKCRGCLHFLSVMWNFQQSLGFKIIYYIIKAGWVGGWGAFPFFKQRLKNISQLFIGIRFFLPKFRNVLNSKSPFRNVYGGYRDGSWLRTLTALAEDLNSVPCAHTRQLTTACNSSPKESNNLSCMMICASYPSISCTLDSVLLGVILQSKIYCSKITKLIFCKSHQFTNCSFFLPLTQHVPLIHEEHAIV